ncbi:hypothetical protein [Priestia aryabhattai]|uniref:hypothetical protein n=1 Tax=Priestia aryabhattai TaxID=412384 RepID=UPI0015F51D39|nr:hypothetical protein [Priestia aryabhattai]
MREETKSNTLHSVDKIKTFTDQLEELCQLSSMTQGEYKECEKVFKQLKQHTNSVEENVYYSS